jgi:dihydroceramidase
MINSGGLSVGLLEDTPGYWGPVTATVDWCEANYRYSPYVCELWNTLSSLVIVATGLIGMVLHRAVLEARFALAFAAVTLVGVGSVAFHGTLRFELQMLDELPMIYSGLIMAFILVENRPQRRFGVWFPAVLIAHGVLVTVLCASTRGTLEFAVFHASFGSLELFALARVSAIAQKRADPSLRRLYRLGMTSYALGLLAWFTDLKACGWLEGTLPSLGLPNPQLHAVWHVLVSCGLYWLTLVIALDRLTTLNSPHGVSWVAGWLPRIVRDASHAVGRRSGAT